MPSLERFEERHEIRHVCRICGAECAGDRNICVSCRKQRKQVGEYKTCAVCGQPSKQLINREHFLCFECRKIRANRRKYGYSIGGA